MIDERWITLAGIGIGLAAVWLLLHGGRWLINRYVRWW